MWSRTQDLQLSAEQSYDPNMDPDNQSLLHYHWECQSTSKVKPCPPCEFPRDGVGSWVIIQSMKALTRVEVPGGARVGQLTDAVSSLWSMTITQATEIVRTTTKNEVMEKLND